MTGLIVVASIVGGLLLLLVIPIRCHVSYDNQDLSVQVKYLFLTFHVCPKPSQKPKKVAKKSKKSFKQEKEDKEQSKKSFHTLIRIFREQGGEGVLDFISHFARYGKDAVKGVLIRTHVKDFRLILIVVGEDAADTALYYGKICMAVYPMFSFLCRSIHIDVKELSVLPGFEQKESVKKFSFRAHIFPIFLLCTGTRFFCRYLAHTIYKQYQNQKKTSDSIMKKQTKAVHE